MQSPVRTETNESLEIFPRTKKTNPNMYLQMQEYLIESLIAIVQYKMQ